MNTLSQNQAAPLQGIRVLDFSRVLAGPWASQLLADYGAEIIKVEQPGNGDETRSWGPPWLEAEEYRESAYFLAANRNKRSICLDLSCEEGQQLAASLASACDVVIENFKVGKATEFSCDYASLSKQNPELVYCSISAFGQQGSRSDEPGYDAMVQASAGLMGITGTREQDGDQPIKVGVAVSDIMAGMYAATAVLAALLERQVSGQGQYIDVPLYDSQVAWLANQGLNYLVSGKTPERMGTAHPNIVPYQAFATQDGHIALAVGNDRQFERFCQCIEQPELAADIRFKTNAARVEHRTQLLPVIAEQLLQKTSAHWLSVFRAKDVPCGPVRSVAEVLSDDYAAEKALVHYYQREGVSIPGLANPVNFSRTPVCYRDPPPTLGQHTTEVLQSVLGMDQAAIDSIAKGGALGIFK